jgi:hypothetical protein
MTDGVFLTSLVLVLVFAGYLAWRSVRTERPPAGVSPRNGWIVTVTSKGGGRTYVEVRTNDAPGVPTSEQAKRGACVALLTILRDGRSDPAVCDAAASMLVQLNTSARAVGPAKITTVRFGG